MAELRLPQEVIIAKIIDVGALGECLHRRRIRVIREDVLREGCPIA